jgi:hypothetical protein
MSVLVTIRVAHRELPHSSPIMLEHPGQWDHRAIAFVYRVFQRGLSHAGRKGRVQIHVGVLGGPNLSVDTPTVNPFAAYECLASKLSLVLGGNFDGIADVPVEVAMTIDRTIDDAIAQLIAIAEFGEQTLEFRRAQ